MAQEINVISYNISVFSAMGFFGNTVKSTYGDPTPTTDDNPGYYPSEARFLRRATKAKEFFDNAVTHLKNQVTTLKPAAIGIQEYHDSTLGQFNSALGEEYEYVPFAKDIFNKARTLTIFDKTVFGTKTGVYESDLGLTQKTDNSYLFKPYYGEISGATKENNLFAANPPGDSGRPISIIKTSKGYFLMNFQGPNRPRLANPSIDVGPLLKEALQIHLTEAEKVLGTIDAKKLIIMCDSNDREHSLFPLNLNGIEFTDGHMGEPGAKSCCYNIDSCGIDKEGDAGFQGPTVVQSMGEFGQESKYIYTGDYVLSPNVVKPVEAVDSPKHETDGASIASDHKLVYAKISLPDPSTSQSDASAASTVSPPPPGPPPGPTPGPTPGAHTSQKPGGSKRRQSKRSNRRGSRSKKNKRRNKRRSGRK